MIRTHTLDIDHFYFQRIQSNQATVLAPGQGCGCVRKKKQGCFVWIRKDLREIFWKVALQSGPERWRRYGNVRRVLKGQKGEKHEAKEPSTCSKSRPGCRRVNSRSQIRKVSCQNGGHRKADYRVYSSSSASPAVVQVSHSNQVSFIFFLIQPQCPSGASWMSSTEHVTRQIAVSRCLCQ